MKTLVILSLALAAASHPAWSQTYNYLNIGANNTPQNKSAVIGNNNDITSTTADRNLLTGEGNWLTSGNGNLMSGEGNGMAATTNSVMFGAWNNSNVLIGSMVIGTGNNHVNSDTSFTMGYNNYSTGWMQMVMGWGLISGTVWGGSNNPSLVVGTFNVDKANLRFAIGNGTDANNRKNAFEVYSDGTVRLGKRQGDLRMGRFGNPADQ